MNPLISVIIPVYKVEDYLKRCIDSIIAQTYHNLEIILVDDGSPDQCPIICDAYALQDPRIKVMHKANEGVGFARNSGLDVCTGEYIMFVDSDDYLSYNAIQVLYERMVFDKSDMAVGKHIDVYENRGENDRFCKWMKNDVIFPEDIFTYLGENNYIAVVAWGKLYRRRIFDNIRYPFNKSAEDLWVFPSIVEKCTKISVVDAVVYYYYQRSTSIMHTKNEAKIYDDTHSKLRTIRYLLDHNFLKSAKRWYQFVIDNELRLKDRRAFKELNRKYLSHQHVCLLLKELPLKQRVKWLLLQFPFSNKLFHSWLQIKNRGNDKNGY